MRRIELGVFAVVALVGLATLLLSVSYFPAPAPFAVQIAPYGQAVSQQGQNTLIIPLEVSEFIAQEVEGVSGDLIPALQGGRIHGREISTTYTQSVMFTEPGMFSGGQVTFGEDEQGEVSDFLQFEDAVFKLQMEFSPGLRSKIVDGELPDIREEDFNIMGERFTIVDSDVNTGSGRVSIKLFGGFGSVEFEDVYTDNQYSRGVQVNGKTIDAEVRIRATQSGDELSIFSIHYVLNANARRGGTLQVLPLHCTREYLQYPTGLLVPDFDICYKGLQGGAVPSRVPGQISGNEVRIDARGDDEYVMFASNFHGQVYGIPLAQAGGMYGNKGRDFVFVEAANPGAPNIDVGDYFLLMSREKNGVTHVMRYDQIAQNQVYFEDLATGAQKQASFDPNTGQGQLLMGEGTYDFVVGAGDALAMDQTNNNAIAGDEARWVFPGGTIADFGPGFTLRIVTPRRLFDDATADEVTEIDILFPGDEVDLDVPDPQVTIPGYELDMESTNGIEQGLTKYGILLTWDEGSGADDLDLVIPGAYARSSRGGASADVFVSFEREKLMKTQAPAPPQKCGDGLISGGEACDPPGSACADEYFGRSGTCGQDCMSCELPSCGNNLLESGEQCEANADCDEGFVCKGCKCESLPEPVCGNDLIERGEQCEKDVDCGQGMMCNNCGCEPKPQPVQPPVRQQPVEPQPQPNMFARFFLWLAELFGA